ncbi:hypothetical protein [Roseomonas sp. AR75]|uniref:hypothetical protein n=1 Tax=Roseomonas sp. AR75 TaxID=2562311 RepID=UPI0010C091AA|nr:hypothetical protein [Roseomonas sp. AR75]
MTRAIGTLGDLFSISLSMGGYGYAISLNPILAFFDLRTQSEMTLDSLDCVNPKIAFKAGVHISWNKRWHKIGHCAVGENLMQPVDFVRQDIISKDLYIYTRFPGNVEKFLERLAPPEECVDLDPLWSWDPEQIEARLEAHLNNTEYTMLKNFKMRTQKKF